jgi:hypothetical protein
VHVCLQRHVETEWGQQHLFSPLFISGIADFDS